MTATQILLLLGVGLLAGLISGGFGVGGGIIIVPALVLIVGFTQHQAQGTSLALMVPPIVILGAMNYYKEGHVDIKVALILMVAFVIGAYFGSKISIKISGRTLQQFFGVFMIIVAIKMILGK